MANYNKPPFPWGNVKAIRIAQLDRYMNVGHPQIVLLICFYAFKSRRKFSDIEAEFSETIGKGDRLRIAEMTLYAIETRREVLDPAFHGLAFRIDPQRKLEMKYANLEFKYLEQLAKSKGRWKGELVLAIPEHEAILHAQETADYLSILKSYFLALDELTDEIFGLLPDIHSPW